MQAVLDAYVMSDNTERPQQGRGMTGRAPAKVFRDGIPKTSRKDGNSDLKTAA